ncbi:hypothetical protein KFE25_007912 [Diacronema lutheri]|uniref:Mitochondrial import inner membrane translocase subunit TIM22 n=1 Tax=Diacronema lutheri TaxID=2081491 RepID=A0A8J5XG83_DIALT|nr:hypothetical protein KFE25_007912 [Diacronema lutheri]
MAPRDPKFAPDAETQGTLYQTTSAGVLGVLVGGVYGAVGSAFAKEIPGTSSMTATASNLMKYAGLFGLGFAIYGGTRATVTGARGKLDAWSPIIAGAASGAVMGASSTKSPLGAAVMAGAFAVTATLAEMGSDPHYLFDFSQYDNKPIMLASSKQE